MRKLRTLRYLYFWLYTFFCIGVPILLINDAYGLFKAASQMRYKVSAAGLVVVIILAFYFGKHIKKMIENMKQSKLKTLIVESLRLIPLILIAYAFTISRQKMVNYEHIAWWSVGSNIVAILFKMKHDEYIEKMKK